MLPAGESGEYWLRGELRGANDGVLDGVVD